MSAPSSASTRQLARALRRLEEAARSKRDALKKGPDGHFTAASATIGGYRLSVRYNRHGQREVSVSALERGGHYLALDPTVIATVSAAHREVYGSSLRTAYTEPRRIRDGGPLYWAVLHQDETNVQGRLDPT
ncbi:MAG: hypothetical protein H0U69_03430 [Trueperaceae bacterium]|nr:hypothetical protein [Trueperaceae bacterium]